MEEAVPANKGAMAAVIGTDRSSDIEEVVEKMVRVYGSQIITVPVRLVITGEKSAVETAAE